jgi:hypothetical protein
MQCRSGFRLAFQLAVLLFVTSWIEDPVVMGLMWAVFAALLIDNWRIGKIVDLLKGLSEATNAFASGANQYTQLKKQQEELLKKKAELLEEREELERTGEKLDWYCTFCEVGWEGHINSPCPRCGLTTRKVRPVEMEEEEMP